MSIKYQYNKIGKDYVAHQRSFFKDEEGVAATDFIIRNLPNLSREKILDFGCGHGTVIRLLEKRGAKKVYGIDASKVMINEAQQFLGRKENLFVEDIQKTHFPKNFFDLVVSRFGLHYLNTFDKAYKEVARILRPGGVFIFIVDHPFRDFEKKKSKDYWKKENVTIKLYGGKVPITFPTHTVGEYFSPIFFKLFTLQEVKEGVSPEAQTEKIFPDYLAVKASKK